uniref:Pleiotrophin/Midkine C-terminal domain-containing protein n=1 Tax=Stomoxys calcitrans TaxID=35570 RepID=A0A1I8NXU3_STOCA
MNLVIASVLLLAMLAFQPTLIYGSKSLASSSSGGRTSSATNIHQNGNSARKLKSSKYGKRHTKTAAAAATAATTDDDEAQPLYSPALSASSKLVLSLDSGDVLVRAARGAAVDKQNPTTVATGVGNGGKRQKGGNNNNNNKKLNKNSSTRENGSTLSGTVAGAGSNGGGRKHLEKKFSATSGLSNAGAQQPLNGGNKGKQRQMLKSQSHQGKRSGNKAIRDDGDTLPGGEGEKTSTCRYSKSVWSECDAKTNTRVRTLSLKKGDASCQQTRTMEKKCKKSCRYEKGAWSECLNGQMRREDKLKATGGSESPANSSCEPMRSISKKCNPNNGRAGSKQANGGGKRERKNKDKGSRRNQKQHQEQQQH